VLAAAVFLFFYGKSVVDATTFLAENNEITLEEVIQDSKLLWILFSSAVFFLSCTYFYIYYLTKKNNCIISKLDSSNN